MEGNIKNKDTHICLACGKRHTHELCPIITNKIESYYKNKQENYLIGNIFLECLKKKEDFFQLLFEIVERYNFYTREGRRAYAIGALLALEDLTEYLVVSIGCKRADFFKTSKKTADEYAELLNDYKLVSDIKIEGISRNEANEIVSVSVEVNIKRELAAECKNELLEDIEDYTLFVCKELNKYSKWNYNVYLDVPYSILNEWEENDKYPLYRDFLYLVASEEKGLIGDFFEDIMDTYWDDNNLVTSVSLDDPRLSVWIQKLKAATINGCMNWSKGGHGIEDFFGSKNEENRFYYSSVYDNSKVKIYINLDNSDGGDTECVYIELDKDTHETIRFGYHGICVGHESKGEPQILLLAKHIEDDLNRKKQSGFLKQFKEKEIKHTDVIIVSHSLICHNNHHMIVPFRGMVPLLVEGEKVINYEIYVGYCQECNRYYVFEDDYYKILEIGVPLCAVYYNGHKIKGANQTPFCYKSQSVLNALGYTVDSKSNLSKEERHRILRKAIQTKLFSIHDLLDFLHWLIRTRNTQSKYISAVKKWEEDIKFVEEYEKNIREQILVDSITVKKS